MIKEFKVQYEERERKLSELQPYEVALLRRTIEICAEAKARGDHPFGCLLADAEGNILMEQGNEEVTRGGDCTSHAEALLMRKASQIYDKEAMSKLTMYNCADSCAMCTGAMYWGNLGRMVYICPESKLKEVTGDDIRNPTLNLPSAVVIACGQKPMEIVGPFPELVPDFLALHEGYWDKGS
ncbi:MAG TPA: nucleoside deaminase [Clostridiaceae bacterium]|jgi:tRNA(Arg) A34 adenosine deaminase TadA|nr:nucleoside deaminase [Clostridiaceae bacterium]